MLEDELTDAAFGRENPEEGEGSGVENFLAVDEDRELAVMSFDGRHVHVERTSQVSRHPGSLNARDSIATAADDDGHVYLPLPLSYAFAASQARAPGSKT
jgi:hypothetical protein